MQRWRNHAVKVCTGSLSLGRETSATRDFVSRIKTPRLDQLAAEGVQLTSFYAPTSVCTPSRAALLTGRFPIRSGTNGHVFFPDESPIGTLRRMIGFNNEIPADEITVAEALHAAGYATGMIGKWHLGALPGFHPNDFGFDAYYGVQ